MGDSYEWLRIVVRALPIVLVHVGGWIVLKELWSAHRGLRRGFVVGGLLAAASFLAPMLMGGARYASFGLVAIVLRWFASFWIVAVLATFLVGVTVLAVRGTVHWWQVRKSRETLENPARRVALRRLGQAVPVAAMATSGGGLAAGAVDPELRELEVVIPGLPKALDGFRIGQTTDVHIGPFVSPADLARSIARLDAAKVDLHVMTGDLIDDVTQLDATLDALASNRAPHGMAAILGNHEYWAGLRRVRAGYDRLAAQNAPVTLLVDRSVVIERDGGKLRIVGCDYPMRERGARDEAMLSIAQAAFRDVQPGETVLCLSHHPDFFPLAVERGAHLTLSGHTHGGQVSLLGLRPASMGFRFPLGRYTLGGGHLYVSPGTGHWLPFRVSTPTEITVLTLRAA